MSLQGLQHPRVNRRPAAYRYAIAVLALIAGVTATGAAHAGLGEPASSVARDHAALHGQGLTVSATGAYQVHEIHLSGGARLREFVAPTSGTVFAVAWTGRSMPDLQQVLASQYPAYASQVAKHRSGHKVLIISTADLNLQILKLPRGFAGSAHIPSLIPPGTNLADLR